MIIVKRVNRSHLIIRYFFPTSYFYGTYMNRWPPSSKLLDSYSIQLLLCGGGCHIVFTTETRRSRGTGGLCGGPEGGGVRGATQEDQDGADTVMLEAHQ